MSRDLTKATGKRSQADCYFVSVDGVDICPCCNRPLKPADTRRHHVREHVEGGLSIRWNVIAICASCHVAIHAGSEEDVYILNTRAKNALVARYGFLNLLQYPVWRKLLRVIAPTSLSQIRAINAETKKGFANIEPLPYQDMLNTDVDLTFALTVCVAQDEFVIPKIEKPRQANLFEVAVL